MGGCAMTREELALAIVARLKTAYPDVSCSLDYDQAWKLLVSVRLAAQCTDARVNVVVQDLYAQYPDVDALADADVADIERIVKPLRAGAQQSPGYQRVHEDAAGCVRRQGARGF